MADDGWEDVSDPNEMKAVLGTAGMNRLIKDVTVSEGQSGVGSNESKTREAQFSSTPQLRTLARDLARAQYFNQRIPTGRWAAAQANITGKLPPNWVPENMADYQSFMGLRQGMAKPVIALTAPAGTTTSSKEMDTPKELELALTSVPGPDKEHGANQYLIDRTGRAVLDKMAFNAFSDRWRAKYGTVYGKDAGGRTMQKAFSDYQASPAYRKTVMTPFTRLIQPKAKRPSSGVDDILKKHGVD
jgi:hypothetical protein